MFDTNLVLVAVILAISHGRVIRIKISRDK
jgi:hypothetical protein